MLSYRFKRSRVFVLTPVIAIFLVLGVLFALVSCQQKTVEVNSGKGNIATLPHPIKQIQVAEGIHKGLIASDHKIYFKGDTDIAVMNGFVLEQNIRIPRFHSE